MAKDIKQIAKKVESRDAAYLITQKARKQGATEAEFSDINSRLNPDRKTAREIENSFFSR